MRLTKAWIVASKEFKSFMKRKNIFYTMLYFEGLVSVGMPFLLRYAAGKPGAAATLPILMNAFSFWFVIGGVLLPVGIASYSLIGEKVQKSLEPLLATPTTDEEILAGKTIAAFLPAVGANLLGAAVFMGLTDLFTYKVLGSLYYPNREILLIVFLLAPLASLLSVGYNILVSSRMNDVRAAQQLGSLIMLPFAGVYILSELKVLTLDTNTLLIIAAVLAGIDVVLFFLARAAFQREEILTRWK